MKNNKYFILCVFIISMCSLGGCSNSFKAINSYSTGIPTDEVTESIISATVNSPTPVSDATPSSAYLEVPTDKTPP